MSKRGIREIDEITLAQLENSDWGEARVDSAIAERCFYLRQKKMKAMSIDDLRFLILQRIGVEFLMPKVLSLLMENPLAMGDYYAGDLLHAALLIGPEFYEIHPKYRETIASVLGAARARYHALADFQRYISVDAIEEAAAIFSGSH